jgi:hypothetical protein
MSLFQNLVGFGTNSWKNRQKPGFSSKSKEAVPKTEVLEQPLIRGGFTMSGFETGPDLCYSPALYGSK